MHHFYYQRIPRWNHHLLFGWDVHIWFSIPIYSVYLLTILRNGTILFVIKIEPSLYESIYYFLSMLALSDLGLSLFSLPNILTLFLFTVPEFFSNACFVQESFIYGFIALESSVLLIMLTASWPSTTLWDNIILTTFKVAQIGIVLSFKNFLLVFPFPFTLRKLKHCNKSQLSHFYCLHPDVISCPSLTTEVMPSMTFKKLPALW